MNHQWSTAVHTTMTTIDDVTPEPPDLLTHPSPEADDVRHLGRVLVAAVAALAVITGLAYVTTRHDSGNDTQPSASPTTSLILRQPEVGHLAPLIDATDSAGRPFQLADLRGRWVVLTFVSDGCLPCEVTTLGLDELIRNEATNAHPAAVVTVANTPGTPFPSVPLDGTNLVDLDGSIAQNFHTTATPMMLLIDPAGQVVFRSNGVQSIDYAAALLHSMRDGIETNLTTDPYSLYAACELVTNPHHMTSQNIETLVDYLLQVRPDALTASALRSCKHATLVQLRNIQAIIEQRRLIEQHRATTTTTTTTG
jgi:hypothetical protein